MKATDVALYLQNNPQFFEDHTDLLAEITLPHPHGGRTVSLSERQLLALREKNKVLEKKLNEMLEFAQDNDALQNKVHQFVCSLFGLDTLPALTDTINGKLRDIFLVPHIALHIWKIQAPTAEILAFTDQQIQPVCTHHAVHDTLSWFGENAAPLRSFAYLPLREGGVTLGLLILASEDAQRFYPQMGTLFLQRIAETVSCALHPRL